MNNNFISHLLFFIFPVLLILSHITLASPTPHSQLSASYLKTLPQNEICETVGKLIYNSTLRKSYSGDLYAFPVSSSTSLYSLKEPPSPLIRCLVRTRRNYSPFRHNDNLLEGDIEEDNEVDNNNDSDDENENSEQQEQDEYIGTGYSISEIQVNHACFFPCSKLLYTFSDSSTKEVRVLVVQKPLSDYTPCALSHSYRTRNRGFFDVENRDNANTTCVPHQMPGLLNLGGGNILKPVLGKVSSEDERNSIVSELPNTLDSFMNRAMSQTGFERYNICVQKLVQIVQVRKWHTKHKNNPKAAFNSVYTLFPNALSLIKQQKKRVLHCLFRVQQPNVYNIIPVTEKLQKEVCALNCKENLYNMTTVHFGNEYVHVSFAPGCVPKQLTSCDFRRRFFVGPSPNPPRIPLAAVFEVTTRSNLRQEAISQAFHKLRMGFSDIDKYIHRYKVSKVVNIGNRTFRVFLKFKKIFSNEV